MKRTSKENKNLFFVFFLVLFLGFCIARTKKKKKRNETKRSEIVNQLNIQVVFFMKYFYRQEHVISGNPIFFFFTPPNHYSLSCGTHTNISMKIDPERLKSRCMEIEESIVGLLHPYQRSRETWYGINAKLTEAKEAMARLETEVDLSSQVDFDIGSCMFDCGQKLWSPQLVSSSPNDTHNRIIDELQQITNQVRKQSERSSTTSLPGSVFASCLSRSIADLNECERLLSKTIFPSQAAIQSLCTPLEPVIKLISSLITESPLSESKFMSVDEVIHRNIFDADQSREHQQHLFSDGNVAEAESQYKEVLLREEESCKSLQVKLSEIGGLSYVVNESKKRAESILTSAIEQYEEIEVDNNDLQTACEADNTSLQHTADSGYQRHREYVSRFKIEMTQSNNKLEENVKQQQQIWTTLSQCERQLNKLARERYTEVQRRIQALIDNEKHRASYEAFSTWTGSRLKILRKTTDHCATVSKVLKNLKTFIQNRQETVSTFYGMIDCKADQIKDDTHETFLKVFREMYLTSGDLISKKTASLTQLQQELNHEKMKLALCQESFDPSARTHANRVKVLLSDVERANTIVQSMEDRKDLYLTWFKPTEEALMITTNDSQHPVSVLKLRESKRQEKINAYNEFIAGSVGSLIPSSEPVHLVECSTKTTQSNLKSSNAVGSTCDPFSVLEVGDWGLRGLQPPPTAHTSSSNRTRTRLLQQRYSPVECTELG